MPIEGLTQQQSDFIERFLKVPKVFNRKAAKARRQAAAEEFRLFNAEHDLIREQIRSLPDSRLKSALLGQLHVAEGIIEKDAKNLDFAGGHAHLKALEDSVALHLKQEEAKPIYAALKVRMENLPPPGALSTPQAETARRDIDLTWDFVLEKFKSGIKSGDPAAMEAALRAMGRLDGLLLVAARLDDNPFELRNAELGVVKAEAEIGLSAAVGDARRRLADVYVQIATLDTKIAAAFGAGDVPVALSMASTAIHNKLKTAVDADPADLPDFAEDAEAQYADLNAKARTLMVQAQTWSQDHAAFLVRYGVMQAHAMASDDTFVKPKFDEITSAYEDVKVKVGQRDYAGASADIADVRRDLKDALDFADDYAGFVAVMADRAAMLAGLPARNTLKIDRLKEDHDAANQLMADAETARDAGQMKTARGLLNQIPGAVAALKDLKKDVDEYLLQKGSWDRWLAGSAQAAPEVLAALEGDINSALATARRAEAEVEGGRYKTGLALIRHVIAYVPVLNKQAGVIQEYFANRVTFAARLAEISNRKSKDGRFAIETYYQALMTDDAQRIAAEAAGDYKLANTLCERLKSKHDEMVKTADECRDYFVNKAAFRAERANLAGSTTPEAIEILAIADDAMAQAIAAARRGNWQAGAVLLENGTLELRRGTSDIENAALVDGMQDISTLDSLKNPQEFAAAYAEFVKVRDHVSGLTTDPDFKAMIKASDDKAKSAESMVGADEDGARDTLVEATTDCKDVMPQIAAKARYEAVYQQIQTALAATKNANKDQMIDGEIERAETAVSEAEGAAASPGPDFNEALKKLGMARSELRNGDDAMAIYLEHIVKPYWAMDASLKIIEDPAHETVLGVEAKRLRKMSNDMLSLFRARKNAAAINKGLEGAVLAAGLKRSFAIYQEALGLKKTCITDLVGAEMAHPATTVEAGQIREKIAGVDALIAQRSFTAAAWAASKCKFEIERAKAKMADFDRYIPEKLACETKLEELETRSVPEAGPGHDAVAALRVRFDAAIAQEDLGNYGGARKRLDRFLIECTPAGEALDLYDRYVLIKTRAQAALDEVRQTRTPAIDPLFARLEGKDTNATRKAAGFDFALAIALFAELEDDCATAKGAIDVQKNFADVISDIKLIAPGDVDDLKAAIAAASATLKQLSGRPSAMYVFEEMKTAQDRLKVARDTAESDFDGARAAVETVADSAVQMSLLMAQYDQLNDAASVARTLAHGLRDKHPQADFAGDEINSTLAAVEAAMTAARSNKSNRAQTQIDIEAAIGTLRDLRKVLDAHAAYVTARTPIETALATLEKDAGRYLINEDMTKIRQKLDTAATRAVGRDHAAADKQLKEAAVLIDAARLRIKLAANEKPTPKELKDILKSPDGHKLLDDIVNKLEPSAQREVMKAAFEARFGCSLELMKPGVGGAVPETELDRPAPNIRRFYEEMAKLPPSNTLDNDSMLTFSHVAGAPTGSAYNFVDKKVLMREGDLETSGLYGISIEHQIGKVDDNAKPKEGKPQTAFSWNTLHEVGHAVDDKLSYMKTHGERLAGWKVYGANVGEPAKIIADEFGFDAGYVADYMMGNAGQVLPIPEPKGCDAEEWDRRREQCRIFVDRARTGNKPWRSAAVAEACAIGNFTYIESYERNWSRYSTDARKIGVSGYQFRAPAEWFSELYAALYTDRLNDAHPHRAWMAQL